MKEEKIEVACVAVLSAFSEVEYPGDEKIVSRGKFYDSEMQEIVAFLKRKDWRDLSWEKVSSEYPGVPSAILSFLSPEASLYYMPAFLLISLDNFDDAAVTALSPYQFFLRFESDTPEVDAYRDSKIELFSIEMLEVVEQCARALIEAYGESFILEGTIEEINEIKKRRSAIA